MTNTSDETPLHFAAQAGDLSEIARLLDLGMDANVQDKSGNTPLKYASAEPRPEAMRALLARGADVNLPDHRGFSPLHCAAGHGFYDEALEMVELLIQHGAEVNARSSAYGFVALHEARMDAIIECLLRHGADPFVRDDKGRTPLEYMVADGRDEDAAFLRKWIGRESQA